MLLFSQVYSKFNEIHFPSFCRYCHIQQGALFQNSNNHNFWKPPYFLSQQLVFWETIGSQQRFGEAWFATRIGEAWCAMCWQFEQCYRCPHISGRSKTAAREVHSKKSRHEGSEDFDKYGCPCLNMISWPNWRSLKKHLGETFYNTPSDTSQLQRKQFTKWTTWYQGSSNVEAILCGAWRQSKRDSWPMELSWDSSWSWTANLKFPYFWFARFVATLPWPKTLGSSEDLKKIQCFVFRVLYQNVPKTVPSSKRYCRHPGSTKQLLYGVFRWQAIMRKGRCLKFKIT